MQNHDLPSIDAGCALFVDFDGTLADLAPRPDAVSVLPGLTDTLQALHQRLDGALAVVSGRPIEQLDRLLSPLMLPSAGVHGAERRQAGGEVIRVETALEGVLETLAGQAEALAAQHAGLLVERKPGALALHYRLAPAFEAACIDLMERVVRRHPALTLLHGKQVVEAKPRGASKGHAIEAFMAEAPFSGRRPLFAGDDVTDEAGFAAAQRLGGGGIKVGAGNTLARWRLPDPAALRQWLQKAAIALA